MKKICLLIVCFVLILSGCSGNKQLKTLLILNSREKASSYTTLYLIPYLDHFGILYDIADLSESSIPRIYNDYSLVIVGHEFAGHPAFEKELEEYYYREIGIVSFDQELFLEDSTIISFTLPSQTVTFNTDHYITALHSLNDTIRFSNGTDIKHVDGLPGRSVTTN